MTSNLTADKVKNMMQLLYDLKARQVSEKLGVKVSVRLDFKEVNND